MRPQIVLSFGNFFAAAHFFFLMFVLAPYLATFMEAESTGIVVSLGAVVTLAAFPFMPRLVAKYSPQALAIAFASLEALFLIWLAIDPTPIAAIIFAALACATSPLLAYQLDLLLEATVEQESLTGRVRTAFLTAGNAALLITPLIMGVLMDGTDNYERVFFAAAVSLLPFILLMLTQQMPRGHVPTMTKVWDACLCLMQDKDLRAIAGAMAVLQFFYHLAPFYIPLYLHTVLGMPWDQLGWIFAVMLIPFVVLEYPAGILADTRLGDRFLLLVGFVIMGISYAAIALITASTAVWVIVAVLVATRIGAALVEAMAEGHFFRRVSEKDTNTVGVFRMMRPASALVAPLVGSLLLAVGSYGVFFGVTGAIILVAGVLTALAIRDIKPEGRTEPLVVQPILQPQAVPVE